jgi:hypothetical protein
MTLRTVLLFLAALTLGGTLLLYIQEKPSADMVFSTEAHLISLSATAISFTAPKGTKRIRVTTENGAEYFTDCLAIPFVCADEAGNKHPISVRAYELSSKVIWPISVNVQGRTVITNEDSRRMYELYLEQEKNMVVRLGLSLAAVFIFFAIKIARRQTPTPSAT